MSISVGSTRSTSMVIWPPTSVSASKALAMIVDDLTDAISIQLDRFGSRCGGAEFQDGALRSRSTFPENQPFLHKVREIALRGRKLRRFGERKEPFNQPINLCDFFLHDIERRRKGCGIGQVAAGELELQLDGGQGISEFMRDTGDETAERRQPIGLSQAALKLGLAGLIVQERGGQSSDASSDSIQFHDAQEKDRQGEIVFHRSKPRFEFGDTSIKSASQKPGAGGDTHREDQQPNQSPQRELLMHAVHAAQAVHDPTGSHRLSLRHEYLGTKEDQVRPGGYPLFSMTVMCDGGCRDALDSRLLGGRNIGLGSGTRIGGIRIPQQAVALLGIESALDLGNSCQGGFRNGPQ